MKDGSGPFQQCYNAQTAVDAEKRIIVAEFNLVCLALNLGRMATIIEWA